MKFLQRLHDLVFRGLRSRILQDSSVMMAGNWVVMGISLVQSVVLARVLGATNYGLIILAIASVTIIIQFLDIRTGEGLTKFMGKALVNNQPTEAMTFFHIGLTADLILMLMSVIVVLVVAPFLVTWQQKDPILQELVWIYTAAVPFVSVQGAFRSVLITFKRFKQIAGLNILSSFSLFAAVIILASYGTKAVMWGYVGAGIFTFLIWALSSLHLLQKNFNSWRGTNYRLAWQSFYPVAFHTSLTASVKSIFSHIDILLLGALWPTSSVSYYKIAGSAASILTLPIKPLQMAIFPAINEAWNADNRERVLSLIKNFVLYSSIITLIGGIMLFIAADFLVILIYGTEFSPVANLIRILIISILISNSLLWGRPVLISSDKVHLLTYSLLIPASVLIVALLLLVPPYGATGAAAASVLSQITGLFLNVLVIMPIINLWPSPLLRKFISD